METSPSPLGHYADAVAALAAGAVVLAFVLVHAIEAIAPMFLGAQPVALGSTAQLDTAAIAVLGYVFGAMGRPASSSSSSSSSAAPAGAVP